MSKADEALDFDWQDRLDRGCGQPWRDELTDYIESLLAERDALKEVAKAAAWVNAGPRRTRSHLAAALDKWKEVRGE